MIITTILITIIIIIIISIVIIIIIFIITAVVIHSYEQHSLRPRRGDSRSRGGAAPARP